MTSTSSPFFNCPFLSQVQPKFVFHPSLASVMAKRKAEDDEDFFTNNKFSKAVDSDDDDDDDGSDDGEKYKILHEDDIEGGHYCVTNSISH